MKTLYTILILLTFNSLNALSQPGALDLTFDPGTGLNGAARELKVQPDGKIVVAGQFASFNGTSVGKIVRLNTDGTLDASFNPGGAGSNGNLFCMALQPDGKILIGGQMTTYNGVARSRIARLNADGTLDTSFDPGTGANSTLTMITVQPDGKILIGGFFSAYDGTSRRNIARLNADGSIDATFDPGIGCNYTGQPVNAIVQPDGKILISGTFTTYNGVSRVKIARINSDGSLDTSFDPGTGANNQIYPIALQSDGKVIIGGNYTTYNGTSINRLARLNADGSLDPSFSVGTGAQLAVEDIEIQTDGKILIVGQFDNYNGIPRRRIARVKSDGSLDTSFDPGNGMSLTAYCSDLQSDGKLVLGGAFTTYDNTTRIRLARVLMSGITWTGATSSDWNTASNWSTGSVPAGIDDVEIPNVANDPVVSTNATINDVTLESGATLVVASGGTLTLDGTLDNSGAVTIQNGGSFLQGASSSITGSGNFSVQRQGGGLYNLWSSPVAAHSGVPGTSYQYVSSASTQDDSDDQPSDPGWSTFNGTMIPGKGYAGHGAGLATFSGTPNNGNINYSLYYAAFDNTFTQTTPGTPFNLVGNPYPSAISAASFVTANPDLDGTIFLWNDNGSNNYSRTDYAYWNGTGGLGTGGGPTPNGYIGSCQGFMVRALNGSAVANFANSQRVSGNNAQFHRTGSETSRLWFSIENEAERDEVLIGFLEDATEDEDRMLDAVKLKSQGINLSTVIANTEYAILAVPPTIEERTIQLNVEVAEAGEYSFIPNTMENFEGQLVYFNDLQTGMNVQLQEGQPITVQLQAGEYPNRFYLNFSSAVTTGIEQSDKDELNAWVSSNTLNLQMSDENSNARIDLVDMNGRVVRQAQIIAFQRGRASVSISGLASGIYTVLVATDDTVSSKKILKRTEK